MLTVISKQFVVNLLILGSALVSCPLVCAQTDSFSIRVDSNLVLVHTEVVDKHFRHKAPPADYFQCGKRETDRFYKLPLAEPYLPANCGDWMIHNLRATDFHVFEDGVEQKVESLKAEPRVLMVARDNLGSHSTWSTTPLGMWSTTDEHFRPNSIVSAYRLGFVPAKMSLGECHSIEVRVDKPDAVVFAPRQFCYIEHAAADPLKGTELGNRMEVDLGSKEAPRIPLSAQAQVLYTSAQMARVDIVLEFPWDQLAHEWIDGDLHSSIGMLGIVYREDGTVANRFSDSASGGIPEGTHLGKLGYVESYDRFDVGYLPIRYETQIDLPVGKYELHMILTDGEKFGRAVLPLRIDGYGSGMLGLGSVVLFRRFRDAKAAAAEAAALNVAPAYVPLVSQDTMITPAAESTFDRAEGLPVYFEIYRDTLPEQGPGSKVQAHMKIVDATGEMKEDLPWFDVAPYRRPGSNSFAVIKGVKVAELPKGEYRLEVEAADDAGRSTGWRSTQFTLK